ncbi:MAG TPA: TOMM precursor leader peptide-binding protein [Actinophytocola sp.]|uniref:TOMM precursor leader peptide-binding protein n=1 Tax=Actinophytocola sp. TaxID=1872138 RepID=UPI002DBB53D7|nr:TOMM precursor leader peptide-binding protein [Actinophytocola sp.]HEU5475370.1 TOMM precursor leader peptide-binding protein [Actinophytocola sp.]
MTQLVGFKRHLRAEVAAGAGAYLFSEDGVTMLKGSRIETLATLLDGTRNLAAVLDALSNDMAPHQVAALIAQLAEAGLVVLRAPAAAQTDESTLAYWDASGVDAAAAVSGTATGTLRLLTVGDVDATAALTALRSARLTVVSDLPDADPGPGQADLSVVLCDDYLNPRLAEVDAAHRAANRPWLLANPVGAKVWIGPIFQPVQAGCWHCLAVRLWGNRTAEACAQNALGRRGPAPRPVASVPPLAGAAVQLIALEATKWLAGYRHSGQRAVWTMDSLELRGEHHAFAARPQCVVCGDPALLREQAHRQVVLTARHKGSYDGGHRALSPEAMLDRYRHLISPVTGLVKDIRRDERGPEFFNSFRSGANLAAAQTGRVDELRAALRAQNGGKGTTALNARVSALCEAVERYSVNFTGDELRIRGSLHSLGEAAIPPNECQLYHVRQYPGRHEWNATHAPFQHVCEPFDEHAFVEWTPVWSLTQQRHRLLPTGLLYFGAPVEQGHDYVFADANGCAAGSSLEDAVLQGMLELVERDAVAIWWYNRTRAPGVDLDSFRDPWIDELRAVYAGLGREVWVLDVTSDLGIPVLVALSRRLSGPAEDIMFGFGAHLDPRVALRRALTELNQLMPQVIDDGSGARYRCDDPDAVHWWRTATVANQPYLAPDPRARRRTPLAYDYTPSQDLLRDVQYVQNGIEARGMEVLVLDQTRPDVGLPVVRVIVPGMRHFWARLGPGRLYDVPVRLGRLAEPRSYEEMNPIPMFL